MPLDSTCILVVRSFFVRKSILWQLALEVRLEKANTEVLVWKKEGGWESMPLFSHTDCGLPLHILLQLVHRHPGVRDPMVALVQRRHSRQGQERGDTDGQ